MYFAMKTVKIIIQGKNIPPSIVREEKQRKNTGKNVVFLNVKNVVKSSERNGRCHLL